MATHRLKTPISEKEIRQLKTNDVLYLTGIIVTARDQAHKRALDYSKEEKSIPIDLKDLALFHCGPVMNKQDGKWVAIAAGPTTSTRMEDFEDKFIERFGIRIVIGKGGMGEKTTAAMKRHGAIYGAFPGGAAVLAANAIKQVKSVEWLDLGMSEAMWVLEVEKFGPLLVAIDSHGHNLFKHVSEKAEKNKLRIYSKLE